MNESHKIRGVFFALAGGVSWGFSGACAQFVFAGYQVDTLWVTSVRMFCAAILMLAIAAFTARDQLVALWKNPVSIIKCALFAIFGVIVCQYAYLNAIRFSNAGTATVLQYIGPVIIVLYVCLRDGRRPRVAEIISLLCCIVGVFFLATHGNIRDLVLTPKALLWGLAAALGVCFYTLIPVKLMNRYGSVPVLGTAFAMGGTALVLIQKSWTDIPPFTPGAWLALLGGLTVIGTALAFAMYLQAVKDVGPGPTSMIASVEAVSATLFAVLWLGTEFVLADLIGFAFIFATVFILAMGEKRQAAAAAAEQTDAQPSARTRYNDREP